MEALVKGLKLFYTDSGKSNAPAIVLIHGFPFDRTMWQEQAALLEPSFRVITYDQRGHGQSDVGDGQYLFEFFVDDLFGLLDVLRIDRVILCGLSMGGYVALRAIERCPERILGLILCDTRSEAETDEGKLKRAAAVHTVQDKGVPAFAEGFLKAAFAPASFKETPLVVEQIRKSILENSSRGICGTLIALATRTDTTSFLPSIRVPSLILVGEYDGITPPSAAKAMHQRIPDSEMAIIPNAGHLSNLENSLPFNSRLLEFAKKFIS